MAFTKKNPKTTEFLSGSQKQGLCEFQHTEGTMISAMSWSLEQMAVEITDRTGEESQGIYFQAEREQRNKRQRERCDSLVKRSDEIMNPSSADKTTS